MRATVAEIDEQKLRENFDLVRKQANGAEIMAIVKANAYGHGIVECAEIFRQCGAEMLGVAFVCEAEEIRASGNSMPIVVLTPPFPDEAEQFCLLNLELVACSREVLRQFTETAVRLNVRLKAHLYIDTGMRRDGIEPEESVEFMRFCTTLPNLEFIGICTHFATSDETDKTFINEQLSKFNKTITLLSEADFSFQNIHAANSGAVADFPNSHFTMVRPGLVLYGYNPSGDLQNMLEIQPVLTLKTRINSLRRVLGETSVSYARKYFTKGETTIATIPLGYGDGLTRLLTGKAECLIHGKRFPIVGAICMDQCMVDVGNENLILGEEVVIIGQQGSETIGADELARKLGTITFEILTGISARVPRVVV